MSTYSDFESGREAGIHEGRRLAALSRRWTDWVIMLLIVVAVVAISILGGRSDRKQAEQADARLAHLVTILSTNSYDGCMLRNAIVRRQVRFYREDAAIEKVNPFINTTIRDMRVRVRESTAEDIEDIGIADCDEYLKTASPSPTPAPK